MNRLEKLGAAAWLSAVALAAVPVSTAAAEPTMVGLFDTGVCLTPATFAAFLLTPTATLGRIAQEKLGARLSEK